jgi:histidinol-phosphate aminotransferase
MSAPVLRPLLINTMRYAPSRHPAPCDLDLSGTELPPLNPARLAEDLASGQCVGYPSAGPLQATLASRFGIVPDQVLITAGSDDALERACRIMLEPGRAAVITDPTFEMLPRWIRLTGAAVREVAWPTEHFPLEAMCQAIDDTTALVAVVTPNNPTGAVALPEALIALARRAPTALILVDLAYIEFADSDPTAALLALPNVVVTRTMSKAWGLPALRLGYAMGPAQIIAAMQRVAPPYPASGPSIAAAAGAFGRDERAMQARVQQIRASRAVLTSSLRSARLDPIPSQANFVATESPRAPWLRDGLAGLGIAIRSLQGSEGIRIRISCPTAPADLSRLQRAIETVCNPAALLFDLDGVLADVSASYRTAILSTAEQFGVALVPEDIRNRKAAGNANDDWSLTHDLVTRSGIDASLEEVTATFERLYQGNETAPGLRRHETLIPPEQLLRDLAARVPLAIVTGRPRVDAERFLETQGIRECFGVLVCREDAALKPDPAPVRLALQQLGVDRAWMLGDTPDDIRAARATGVVPLGILAPGEPVTTAATLLHAGAARVLTSMEELQSCLP